MKDDVRQRRLVSARQQRAAQRRARQCVLYYGRLNAIAQRYESASDGVAKREALRDYLRELRVLAIIADPQEGYPYINFDPLYELVESLHRIDNEETPPLLRPPARKTGARPTQLGAQRKWARASALITILMKRGSARAKTRPPA